MILLAVNATIFYEVASTLLQFYVVHCSFATGGTHLLVCLLATPHITIRYAQIPLLVALLTRLYAPTLFAPVL
jgi:hypothetical protein